MLGPMARAVARQSVRASVAPTAEFGAMYIAILFRFSFPHGMALANRFIALAKGLTEHGESVVVLCLTPASREQAPEDLALRGAYEGIEYMYTSPSLFRARSRARHRLQMLRGFIGGIGELHKRRRSNELDVVFFSWIPHWQKVVVLLFGRLHGVRIVQEQNEHLYEGAGGRYRGLRGGLPKLLEWLDFRMLTRFCSGIEVISTPLEQLLRPQLGKRARMLVLPAVVDVSRFERDRTIGAPPLEGPYVAWCGSRWDSKDGAHQLLLAFGQIAAAHPKVSLLLIAPHDDSPDYRRATEIIHQSGCSERIAVTGRVSQADIPRFLLGASVLALARPSSAQAEYGFPTKLPEYLATGRPVLATRVGDIPLYLQDGVNAYLVEPDDVPGFAEKLDYILQHPEEADAVGQKGRLLTTREFSSVFQAGRLASFFGALV
jgi:glycosyltransferase involved in cell wall biosynthesis